MACPVPLISPVTKCRPAAVSMGDCCSIAVYTQISARNRSCNVAMERVATALLLPCSEAFRLAIA
jgi:hypothetical protein